MNFFNLIKFRKIFLILIWISIIYFLQKFIYFSRSLRKNSNLAIEQNFDKRTELNYRTPTRKIAEKISFNENYRVAKFEDNCGGKLKCREDEFSIHLNTGYQNSIYPKLCIDDKYFHDRSFNRGINVVTIDNTTKSISNLQTFDTYLKDSTNFEFLLLSMRPGDKIILFTYDEVPAKLSKVSKLLLHELFGSFHIQNLQFRTAWYLVSEKQIKGYSPFEEIHLPVAGQWPASLDVHFCIPFQMKGDFVKVDQSLFGNNARVEYCKQFGEKWKGFCKDDVVNEPLYANSFASTNSNSLIDNTPILVFSDLDNNEILSFTLETVFRQSGIMPRNVLVFYYQESKEVENLANLFQFKSFKIDLNSNDFLNEINDKIDKEFSSPKQVILVFGNPILTADFLNYFAQLLPLIEYSDSKLSFISAWNDNCLNNMCADEKLVYRVKGSRFDFRHALAIKFNHQFYPLLEKIILLNCLNNQSMTFDDLEDDGLMPDFPRIINGKQNSNVFLDDENSEKRISLFENVKIDHIDALSTVDSYRKSLIEFEENSIKIKDEESLIHFLENYNNSSSINLTVFTNSTASDNICTIFNLRNCYFNYFLKDLGDLFRFNNDQLNVLLIKKL